MSGRLLVQPRAQPDTTATVPAPEVLIELRLSATGTWISTNTYSVVLTGVRDVFGRVLSTTTISATPVAPSP